MRLQKIEPRHHHWLGPNDQCWHYGEYTSEGGYGASETNRQIFNLKKKPTAKAAELHYKGLAINYWGDSLRQLITLSQTVGSITFVPMPGSKPLGHAEYDDRMVRVLQRMAVGTPGVDIRALLKQVAERPAQHHGQRLWPQELLETLALDLTVLPPAVAPTLCLVDDVITAGSSFNAAKTLLATVPGVQHVVGIFLAKSVRAAP